MTCTKKMLERIARHADIDTRRAMGIYGRLPVTDFVPRGQPTTFVYFPEMNKIRYINFHPDDSFMWEVYEDIHVDGNGWRFGPKGRSYGVWIGADTITFDSEEVNNGPFHFAGDPEIIRPTPHS